MPTSPKTSHQLTVLVVEDNFPSRQYLLFLLKKLNVEVVAVETGEKALEAMKDRTVDCMLLDIALGSGISGLSLMEELRKEERFRNIAIIAVTASWQGVLEELVQKGFTDVLSKPYTFQQLKEILEKYLPIQDRHGE